MRFFGRFLYKLSTFMQGRYGMDGLYIPLLIISCAFTLLGTLFHSLVLRLIGSAFLILLVCRSLSKNHRARQKELYAYYNLKNKLSSLFGKNTVRNTDYSMKKEQRAAKKAQRKFKRYFKCPKCKTKLSVPKGKGKIQITCVKCKHQFIKKT